MYRYERRESKFKYVFITVLLMIVSSFLSIYIYKMYTQIDINNYTTGENNTSNGVRLAVEEKINNDVTSTLENVSKCVVGISKIKSSSDSIFEKNATQSLSLGTGTIVSNNGYIITNWHLAGNKYSSCYITLEDGTIYNGSTVWADEDLDLAIVKINVNGIQYLHLGDSDSLKIGENVYAIGNPIGIELQRTVTSGIISGLNRTIKLEEESKLSYMEDLIQTDASINQGNSGGPLINRNGEVIGINTVKIDTAEGIGFAVPINIIKPVLESFITSGKFDEAYLGIFAYDKEAIKYLQNGIELENGIYVVKINAESPLQKTNLKAGDIIIKIDDISVNRMSELRSYIYTKKAGDTINITYIRNKKQYNVQAKLKSK